MGSGMHIQKILRCQLQSPRSISGKIAWHQFKLSRDNGPVSIPSTDDDFNEGFVFYTVFSFHLSSKILVSALDDQQ